MSNRSRSCAGAAFLTVLISIPAMAQAQASVAERSLMNRRAGTELATRMGETWTSAESPRTVDQEQASRALLGTVGAVVLTPRAEGVAGGRFPTPEEALLGEIARPKSRRES